MLAVACCFSILLRKGELGALYRLSFINSLGRSMDEDIFSFLFLLFVFICGTATLAAANGVCNGSVPADMLSSLYSVVTCDCLLRPLSTPYSFRPNASLYAPLP